MDVISWDLDSTLVDTRHRQHMILEGDQREHTDWVAYSRACSMDTEGPAWEMLQSLQFNTGLAHVVVSRRDYSAWEQTRAWFVSRGTMVFEEFMLLKGPHSTPEEDHGLWKVAQIRAYEQRSGNQVILHVDDAPIQEQFAKAGIPFIQIVSAGSEFITRPKIPVG